MKYVKETSNMGLVRFAAIRPDSLYELIVTIHEKGKVAKIQLDLHPTVDTRPECSAEEFTAAYILGLERFATFMLSLNEVPNLPACHSCGTQFPTTDYFQTCIVCNPLSDKP